MPTFNFKNSLVAGALAAIGASVCCVVPLVLLMMGIGGAWIASLTALEPLLRKQRGAWIGWPGVADSDEELIVRDELTMCPVKMSADEKRRR